MKGMMMMIDLYLYQTHLYKDNSYSGNLTFQIEKLAIIFKIQLSLKCNRLEIDRSHAKEQLYTENNILFNDANHFATFSRKYPHLGKINMCYSNK